MSYKICVVTGTRAEYGLLLNVIRRIHEHPDLELDLIVTGTHLSDEHGRTVREIEADGWPIACCIDILAHHEDSLSSMAQAVARGIEAFAERFTHERPDLMLILGDRYEIFAAASAAVIMKVPVAHIHGGETTQGAIDEYFRHAITKMSVLHFPTTCAYAHRILRMGENPSTVYNVGSLGVENIRTASLFSRQDLQDNLGFPLDAPYALVTYHPETLGELPIESCIGALFDALTLWTQEGNRVILTKANADTEGRTINDAIDAFSRSNARVYACASLGRIRYLSAIKYCEMVVGNSSSGIIEAPSFRVPTINIGERQKGRLMAESVICCQPTSESIIQAMQLAASPQWRARLKKISNPYGEDDTSAKIVSIIERKLKSHVISIKKEFFDG